MNAQKNVDIGTMPISKTVTLMNYMIASTVNHLNKYYFNFRVSYQTEEKLFEFDNKLKELEVMVSLFESKLNSLPQEVTSTYPDLVNFQINDFSEDNSFPIQNTNTNVQINNQPQIQPQPETQPQINQQSSTEINNTKEVIVDQATQQVLPDNNENQEGIKELTDQEKLDQFLKDNPNCEKAYKAMKMKVPSSRLIPQARLSGVKESTILELIELHKKIDSTYN